MSRSNYDLKPKKVIYGYDEEAYRGADRIAGEIANAMQGKKVLICDLYPGVNIEDVMRVLCVLDPTEVFYTDECKKQRLEEEFKKNITDDRVFGLMSYAKMRDCFDVQSVARMQRKIDDSAKIAVVIGVGAAALFQGDLLVYFDMPRWEIQLRHRRGDGNWLIHNPQAPQLTKYKIGYFIEWRLADRHKLEHFKEIDFFIDTTNPEEIRMITKAAMDVGLDQIVRGPFRLQPYFDPGVWGGQWMKEKFQLDPEQKNYAWSFDGVPEENSINLQFKDVIIEMPCMNLVLNRPHELLGEKVHARFGREFPIRFDLLDTMGGQNLSLQVHPLTEYIQETFDIPYTQDESYYILDAQEGAKVYLGVKDNIDPDEMKKDLYAAQEGLYSFPAEKYINSWPAKKHDHFLIPAGTVHCSGADTMVLEISATPYIFTFKLWDWGRVGLDGKPRPIHIDHGMKNIQFNRNSQFVREELIHQEKILKKDRHVLIEKTGLHEREFIETKRYTIRDAVEIHMTDSVQMLNLVEGESVIIESIRAGGFSFTVHYAETFIIPACVKKYRIVNPATAPAKLICAYVG